MVGSIGLKIHNIRASGSYISEANAEASELINIWGDEFKSLNNFDSVRIRDSDCVGISDG
ncbi:13409_t:CDS:2 [Cetraspora pellucida]|uniref:13409_t:CDS:1 n=1 Tax=Cetraspora pellucida TaxID=1433469 RepID=A0A9N9HNM7_9GLOM|nr:13409_t:CDS:2 [Cetraspora pellucida]